MARTAHRIVRERCFFCDQERTVIRMTNTFRICLECIDYYRADLASATKSAGSTPTCCSDMCDREPIDAEPLGSWE